MDKKNNNDSLNKKIKNVKKIVYDNIEFKSKLESNCYKIFKENNFILKYESFKVELTEKKVSNINIFLPNKKSRSLEIKKQIERISYSVDFFMVLKRGKNKKFIFIETKGYPNDVYPIKKKLFLLKIEKMFPPKDVYFFEVHNIKQIYEALNTCKSLTI